MVWRKICNDFVETWTQVPAHDKMVQDREANEIRFYFHNELVETIAPFNPIPAQQEAFMAQASN